MSSVNCLIQAAGPAVAVRDDLERGLVEIHDVHSPSPGLDVSWQLVPEGFLFTEGRPSTTSIVSFTLDHPTTLPEREAFLGSVCELFADLTGCTVNEVLAAITPPTEES
ncbi:MAG: hypothetical protein AAGF02_02860 [Actinomycetota bacterium]